MPGAERRAVRQGAYLPWTDHEELIVLMTRPPAGTLDVGEWFVSTRPSAGVLLRTMEAGFALTGDAGLETGAPNGPF